MDVATDQVIVAVIANSVAENLIKLEGDILSELVEAVGAG